MRRKLLELIVIVIVIVIARMTRNDPQNKHESCLVWQEIRHSGTGALLDLLVSMLVTTITSISPYYIVIHYALYCFIPLLYAL